MDGFKAKVALEGLAVNKDTVLASETLDMTHNARVGVDVGIRGVSVGEGLAEGVGDGKGIMVRVFVG